MQDFSHHWAMEAVGTVGTWNLHPDIRGFIRGAAQEEVVRCTLREGDDEECLAYPLVLVMGVALACRMLHKRQRHQLPAKQLSR